MNVTLLVLNDITITDWKLRAKLFHNNNLSTKFKQHLFVVAGGDLMTSFPMLLAGRCVVVGMVGSDQRGQNLEWPGDGAAQKTEHALPG